MSSALRLFGAYIEDIEVKPARSTVCPVCGKDLKSVKKLKVHEKTHDSKPKGINLST